MKDIKVFFNGASGATIDLSQKVEGKSLCEQKCLVNIATEVGSDPIYEDRGTDLMAEAVGGAIVSENDAIHAGNFAALDTMSFVAAHYPTDEETGESGSPLRDLNITTLRIENGVLSYAAQLEFTDGSSTGKIDSSVITNL